MIGMNHKKLTIYEENYNDKRDQLRNAALKTEKNKRIEEKDQQDEDENDNDDEDNCSV